MIYNFMFIITLIRPIVLSQDAIVLLGLITYIMKNQKLGYCLSFITKVEYRLMAITMG